jgi:hypothetical protein
MTMFAAHVTGDTLPPGGKVWRAFPGYTCCFAGIGASVKGVIENAGANPENCLGHVLILATPTRDDPEGFEACRTFLLSDAVKTLTNNGIVSAEAVGANWFGVQVRAKLAGGSYTRDQLLHVVFKMDSHADGIITALRVSQCHWKLTDRRSYRMLSGKELEVLPLVSAISGAGGMAFSDSYPTFVPVTAAKVREYLKGQNETDLDDIYYTRAANFAVAGLIWDRGLSLAVRILRGERLPDRPFNQKIYNGYIKDEYIKNHQFVNFPDEAVMSITGPWSLPQRDTDLPFRNNQGVAAKVRHVLTQLQGE